MGRTGAGRSFVERVLPVTERHETKTSWPQFHLTEQDINDLADFLEFVSRINTQGWPPNQSG